MFFYDNMHKKYFQIRWIFAASDIQATGKEDSCLKDADKTSETQGFHVNIAKLLRTPILKKIW